MNYASDKCTINIKYYKTCIFPNFLSDIHSFLQNSIFLILWNICILQYESFDVYMQFKVQVQGRKTDLINTPWEPKFVQTACNN